MVMTKGITEVLELANSDQPKSFNDFTKISINGKHLSSATISKRLDKLIAVNAIGEIITRSKSGRRIIAYRITAKGKKVIDLSKELEEALGGLKDV